MGLSIDEKSELERMVRRAGEILMEHWPRVGYAEFKIDTKTDGSNVSEADYASNEHLVQTLNQIFPSDGIVSEEGVAAVDQQRNGRVWIIDPLDGTSSFLNGRDDFSVLVALSDRGEIVYSLMLFPAKDLFAVSERQAGALLNGVRQRVSAAASIRPARLYARNYEPLNSECVYPDRMDSGMAFLQLARGELDGVVIRMTHHREWDVAAPLLLVEESGGRVTDEHGRAVRFDRPGLGYEYLVATNEQVHSQAIATIPR